MRENFHSTRLRFNRHYYTDYTIGMSRFCLVPMPFMSNEHTASPFNHIGIQSSHSLHLDVIPFKKVNKASGFLTEIRVTQNDIKVCNSAKR
jgi:hypothetical protein